MNRPLLQNGKENLALKMNSLGAQQIPFLFAISYDVTTGFAIPLHEVPSSIAWNINGSGNVKSTVGGSKGTFDSIKPVALEKYRAAFDNLIEEVHRGNTYVANLTFPTEVECPLSLREIFCRARAPFKLLVDENFTTFSPEGFIKIRGNRIETFPMKGTIDACITGAKEKILADEKEMAEHVMIVDLLRNDLSMVSRQVKVESFRYIERINAGTSPLLQVSSRIAGRLETGWQSRVGTIITTLLPAGSITGAPKRSTVEILSRLEAVPRGFYTGIFGCFTGNGLESAVMIRFITRKNGHLFFHSGGGITIDSNAEKEYEEMLRKIYLPF